MNNNRNKVNNLNKKEGELNTSFRFYFRII